MARFTYIPNRVIDINGISDGATIDFFATGTTTPITIYSDEARTTPISNPYTVAAGAAVPVIYYADAEVRVRVTDSGGNVVSDDDPYSNLRNDLASTASGKGAALVGFLQDGAGAVGRTLLDKARESVSVKDFGAVGDGVTDDTAAIQAAFDVATTVLVPRGSYLLSAGLNKTGDFELVFEDGAEIVAGAGIYPTGYAINITGAATQIGDLGVDAAKGETALTFAVAPGLAANDLIAISDPAASSWSAWRAEYHAGEFCKVVTSIGTTVKLQRPLYDGYAAASVDVYSIAPARVTLRKPQIRGTGPSNGLVSISYGRNVMVEGGVFRHKNNSCLLLSRCVDFSVVDCSVHNEGDGGDDYGLSISNSQHGKVTGGDYFGRRHGVAVGGDSNIVNVPCRDIIVLGATIGNDAASAIHSADLHGNSEFCGYYNCTIYNGVSLQGANTTCDGCTLYGGLSNGVIVQCGEILGDTISITNNKMHGHIEPTSNRGVVDFGGVGNVVNADTTRDLTVIVEGNTINADIYSASTKMVTVRNRGSTNKINLSVQGNVFNVNALQCAAFVSLVSGTAQTNYIVVDKNIASVAGAYSLFPDGVYHLLPKLRLQAHEWAETVVLSTGAAFLSGSSEAFSWRFPRSPVVTAAKNANLYAANRIGIVVANPVSPDAATLVIGTDDATNFGAASGVTLSGRAAITEV